MTKCVLTLEDLKLKIYLGITAVERSKKQTVILQIKIIFAKPPLACKTGNISDTICYAKLTRVIKKFCNSKKFTLIEQLGMQLAVVIKKEIPPSCKLCLRVTKLRPVCGLSNSMFEITRMSGSGK